MQLFGANGFMLYMVTVFGLQAAYAFYRMTMSEVLPPDETGDLLPVTPMATAVTAVAVAEEMEETATDSTTGDEDRD